MLAVLDLQFRGNLSESVSCLKEKGEMSLGFLWKWRSDWTRRIEERSGLKVPHLHATQRRSEP